MAGTLWGQRWGDPWGDSRIRITRLRVIQSPHSESEIIVTWDSVLDDVFFKVYVNGVLFRTTTVTKVVLPVILGRRVDVQVLDTFSGDPSYDPQFAVDEGVADKPLLEWFGVGLPWGGAWGRHYGPCVDRYEISRDGEVIETIPDDEKIARFDFTDELAVVGSQDYQISVIGCSTIVSAVCPVVPAVLAPWPDEVTIVECSYDKSAEEITITWIDPVGLGGGAFIRVYLGKSVIGTEPIIDYSTVVQSVAPGVQKAVIGGATLEAGKVHLFGLRVFDGTNEEKNTKIACRLVLDSSAPKEDITNKPNSPIELAAFPSGVGKALITGIYDHFGEDGLAVKMRLFWSGGGGGPGVDFTAPIDEVALVTTEGFEGFLFEKTGLTEGVEYFFGVRAETAFGVRDDNIIEVSVLIEEVAPICPTLDVTVPLAAALPAIDGRLVSATIPATGPNFRNIELNFENRLGHGIDGDPKSPIVGRPRRSDAPRIEVRIGQANHADPDFLRRPEFTAASITRRTGKDGSKAIIRLDVPVSEFKEQFYEAIVARDDPIYGFNLMDNIAQAFQGKPQITQGSLVRISVQKRIDGRVEESILFLGCAVRWQWNHEIEQMELFCRDFTWRMDGLVTRGRLYNAPVQKFVLQADSIFNKDGRPDQLAVGDSFGVREERPASALHRFAPPDFERLISGDNTGPVENPNPDPEFEADDYAEFAIYWAPGDILEYLRIVHSDAIVAADDTFVTAGLTRFKEFMVWDAAILFRGTNPTLFESTNSRSPSPNTPEESPATIMGLDLTGKSLSEAISDVLKFTPGYDWMLEPFQLEDIRKDPSLAGKARFVLFDLVNTDIIPNATLAQINTNILENKSDIEDHSLVNDLEGYFNKIIAHGAFRRIEISFQTPPKPPNFGPGLEPNWTDQEESQFLLEVDELNRRSIKHPKVFLEWRVPEGFDIEAYIRLDFAAQLTELTEDFGGQFFRIPRKALRGLLTTDFTPQGNPIRRDILIERSLDGGATYEPLPDGIDASVLRDEVGFRLASNARAISGKYQNDEKAPWTFDKDTKIVHDMRCTIVIESDDRLVSEIDASAGELVREFFVLADKVRFDARRGSIIYNRDSDVVTTEIRGDAGMDIMVDGTDRLKSIANHKMNATNKKKNINGTIEIPGISQAYPLGVRIIALGPTPGPILDSDRPRYFVEVLVRGLTWNLGEGENLQTILTVEPTFSFPEGTEPGFDTA